MNIEALPGVGIEDERHDKTEKIRSVVERQRPSRKGLFILLLGAVLGTGTISEAAESPATKDEAPKNNLSSVELLRDKNDTELRNKGIEISREINEPAYIELEKSIGPYSILLVGIDSVHNEAERQRKINENEKRWESKKTAVVFENVEKMYPGMTADDLKEIVSNCIPHGFAVEKIIYNDIVVKADVRNGTQGGELAHVPGNKSEIYVSKAIQDESAKELIYTLFHESGHCADSLHNKLLTFEERVELEQKLIDRVKSTDRYKSNYVESIKIESKDPKFNFAKRELYVKAGEYFAEITMQYLAGHKNLLPEADRKIVEWVINKTDPHFNFEYASSIANSIADRIEKRQRGDKDIDKIAKAPEKLIDKKNEKKSYDELSKDTYGPKSTKPKSSGEDQIKFDYKK